jgi:hypothetical protein
MAERFADQARQRLDEFSAAQSEGIWERANRTLHDHYARLAESVESSMNIGWGLGGPQATPACPLRSHASYRLPGRAYPIEGEGLEGLLASFALGADSASPPSVEVNVDFRQDGADERSTVDYLASRRSVTALRYTVRISRRDEVLREGPTGVIEVRHGAIGSYGAIKAAIAEIGRFIEDSGPFIREQLRAAAG